MRFGLPNFAHPVLALLGVVLLGAAVTTSATIVRLDAMLGSFARDGADVVSQRAGFVISQLGATDFVMPLTAAAALILLMLRHWRGALTLVLAVLSTQLVVALIKAIVERPRPELNGRMTEASGFSFPSAHSATSMAVYATLTLLLASVARGAMRMAVVIAGCSLIATVGLSRVLLAAHYPTDVLAGWLTGAAIAAASWLLVRKLAAALRPQALPA
jgi:undecaprenyl-diphosphatase